MLTLLAHACGDFAFEDIMPDIALGSIVSLHGDDTKRVVIHIAQGAAGLSYLLEPRPESGDYITADQIAPIDAGQAAPVEAPAAQAEPVAKPSAKAGKAVDTSTTDQKN